MNSKSFGFKKQGKNLTKIYHIIFSSLIFVFLAFWAWVIVVISGGNYLRFVAWKPVQNVLPYSWANSLASKTDFHSLVDQTQDLLGFVNPKKYLIVLMNADEVRPLGGFFGSFAIVDVASWNIKNTQVHDVYWLPSVKKEHYCDENFEQLNLGRCIGFVDAARVGFSDIDGEVVNQIYQKTFSGEQLDGVIFVNSNLGKLLIPSYEQLHWYWEFSNATSNLKNENHKYSKSLYRAQANKLLQNLITKSKQQIIKKIWQNRDLLKGNVWVYIPGVKNDFLDQFTRIYQPNHFYYFDSDRSFSKVRKFVDKEIYVWSDNRLVYKGDGGDLGALSGKKVLIKAVYSFDKNKQKQAIRFFNNLVHLQWLELSQLKKHILGYDTQIKTLTHLYVPNFYNLQQISFSGDLATWTREQSLVDSIVWEYDFASGWIYELDFELIKK